MRALITTLFAAMTILPTIVRADPCGMVPPIYTGPVQPIKRVGLQETYVFYKDGIETFVIRPGYEGKVDEFGMLIPFPKPPALRKMPDHIFTHLAAAIDPPEVVVYAQQFLPGRNALLGNANGAQASQGQSSAQAPLAYHAVRVVRQEAVGMYEVAVLEAGSAEALKKWIDEHGFKYPEGMDGVCEEYVKDRWCFVAVKTKVGQKNGVDPKPAQRNVNSTLPAGSTFDGRVQAMGFRFPTDELVVPMRLSAFNEGELRNVVYLLTDSPKKIRSIPEEYVVRQISGEELFRNLTEPLPLRIIGGGLADIPEWRKKNLPEERKPGPHNGAARDTFAADLLAVSSGKLSLDHEEAEKNLLNIGERLGLRGAEIDKMHEEHLTKQREAAVASALKDLKSLSLTVVDGDFPREVLARKNLQFGEYKMPSRRNKVEVYDVKSKSPSAKQPGVRHLGAIDWQAVEAERIAASDAESHKPWRAVVPGTLGLVGLSLLALGLLWNRRRIVTAISITVLAGLVATPQVHADPCGMVPPIYTGEQNPITRIGEQKTFVFYKDGVETFVIRPGFSGKTDEFGMLIPFPKPPALRKAPDHTFPHVAAAIDPPEVVIDLRQAFDQGKGSGQGRFNNRFWSYQSDKKLMLKREEVRVLKEEAVGMYEIAVLEAGSPAALKKWMDKHGYKYPEGMDGVCEEYVEDGWCFVAVKTKVGQKEGVDPKPAQRSVNAKLPDGATFDGHVQAMGFRFKTDELVVPMRLSAFNEGELRNIVYLLTDKPQKIRSIPEEYVVRQISGEELYRNVTGPLPLRIIGGSEKDIPDGQRKSLPQQRDPKPHNAAAKDLFAGDLLAVSSGELSLAHEEQEKNLLAIGERLGMRGKEVDQLHYVALTEARERAIDGALAELKSMTLTVVDGDFPREVLARKNLSFGEYRMPSRRNSSTSYDAKSNGPAGQREGNVILGSIDWEKIDVEQLADSPHSTQDEKSRMPTIAPALAMLGLLLACLGIVLRQRSRLTRSV